MRLEPLYSASFTTPESWSVDLAGQFGTEAHSFLVAEGRSTGRLSARLRGANVPRRRADGTLLPDFRGVLETDDGATILYSWTGRTRVSDEGRHELVGGITHITDDERYQWLNHSFCGLTGEVLPRADGSGFDVVLEVAEIVWEPPPLG